MAGKRKITVDIIGDADSLKRAFGESDKAAGKWKSRIGGAAKAAGVGMAAGVGLAAIAVKGFVAEAVESEKSNARMRAQLKASGISYKGHADQIEKVIQKHSALSGLDDEDLQDSFTNIVRVTGDVTKALKLNGLAADFARAKGMDVAKAGELVGKVAGGNIGILSRYGIKVKEGATAQEALAEMQKRFAGQAKAYGETAAGAQDRFKVAVDNVKEAIGARLLPIVAAVTNTVTGFVTGLLDGSSAAGGFGQIVGGVFETVKGVVATAIAFMRGQFNAHRDDFANVRQAVRNVGVAFREVWEHVALPIIRRVLPAIVGIVKGAFNVIGGAVKVLTSILTGDFGAAWNGVKQIFRGALQVVGGIIRAATAPFREAAAQAGQAISGAFSGAWERVREGVRAVKDWMGERFKDIREIAGNVRDTMVGAFNKIAGSVKKVLDFLGDIIAKVKSVIDWIGKIKIPSIKIPFIGGEGGGRVGPGGPRPASVDGFNDDAAAFGNVVTSGYRPGDRGWHGQNRARDYAGGNMLGFARYMLANFAPYLLELIHSPLGVGVKNGQIVSARWFGSDVYADHFDHVHVAMKDGGKVRRGGWALVGEEGPELARLPTGTRVHSHGESKAMLGGVTINYNGTVNIGSRKAAEVQANRLAYRINHGAVPVG